MPPHRGPEGRWLMDSVWIVVAAVILFAVGLWLATEGKP